MSHDCGDDTCCCLDPEDDDHEACECCGSIGGGCGCAINLVDDEDPSVGYHSQIWWCFTHARMAE